MNRLALLAALVALPAGAAIAQHAHHQAASPVADDPIAAAIAAPSRTPKNVARDKYRHPAETLAFFGMTPSATVVEYSPSGGWYTEILAPLLRDHGSFYALQPTGRYMDGYKAFLAARPDAYDKVKLVAYPEETASIPANSVDTVLTFRNVHNMVMAGNEAATFKAFFDMLKPGGTLGVVDHRLPEDRDTALEKSSGYLKVSTIRRIAQAAGFDYVGASEVNANPKDTADWPKGVWTLPPTLSQKDVDRDTYLAIGESDRMTLKFRKPAQ
ncbi:class I SAM-dependent methyltransferase [Sphingobium sp. CAP-1]|uniref:class I SAM-dependent methyltransferase n=1 Tax=Sphingobium sp. CAP-1 TaxID=2676077 RepID=UPI0012BB4088|nr:class I SAM-dependent methyltransferase [Sphingobium sp. CAP-1]QGP78914.1 methyltransferase [Sphingobium sp. CAP-1]